MNTDFDDIHEKIYLERRRKLNDRILLESLYPNTQSPVPVRISRTIRNGLTGGFSNFVK